MKNSFLALALLMGLSLPGPSQAQKYSFSVINAGVPQTVDLRPYSITDSGTILAQAYPLNGQFQYGTYLISGTSVTEILPGAQGIDLAAINNAGWQVGNYFGQFIQDAQDNFSYLNLPAGGDTFYVTNISNSDEAVGMAMSATKPNYGFTYVNGVFTAYTYPGSTGCSLNGVNSAGDLAGTYFVNNDHSQFYAFLVHSGKSRQISVPGCIDPNPSTLSDSRQLVGSAVPLSPSGSTNVVGFVTDTKGSATVVDYKPFAPKTVTGPSGAVPLSSLHSTQVFGINASGQIVGEFTGTYSSSTWSETLYIPFMGTPTKAKNAVAARKK